MARYFLFTTLFFCFLSLGSSKKKPDKIPITTQATTDIPLPCKDTGCKSHFGDEAACVYVLHGNWSLINNEYKINTDYVPNLCRGSFDDCCRCFRRKITDITAPPTTTTSTTTSTTITTPTTTTTPPVGCIDVDGSCRAAFGGAGACIDVRTGNLTDIDPEVTPLANKCGRGPEKCCECFKMKTAGCCKALYTKGADIAVFHLTDTYNNKPVYHYKNGRVEYCIYYGKQWMVGFGEAICKGKTSDSKGVIFSSKSNVECPNQIKTGHWYNSDGKETLQVFPCACCETLRFIDQVVHLADIHNNRPVYKDRNEEYCVYYGKQWMVRKCKAFYEDPSGNKGVEIFSKSNVDCPDQIETGDWYHPDGKEVRDGSFSCECCIAIQYGKERYYLEDTHNNRPVYKDSKEEYCIYYGKQWLVRSCKAFYEDKNGIKGVKLLNKANMDCPVQIGGNMYWYTPDGKEIRDVFFSCVPHFGY